MAKEIAETPSGESPEVQSDTSESWRLAQEMEHFEAAEEGRAPRDIPRFSDSAGGGDSKDLPPQPSSVSEIDDFNEIEIDDFIDAIESDIDSSSELLDRVSEDEYLFPEQYGGVNPSELKQNIAKLKSQSEILRDYKEWEDAGKPELINTDSETYEEYVKSMISPGMSTWIKPTDKGKFNVDVEGALRFGVNPDTIANLGVDYDYIRRKQSEIAAKTELVNKGHGISQGSIDYLSALSSGNEALVTQSGFKDENLVSFVETNTQLPDNNWISKVELDYYQKNYPAIYRHLSSKGFDNIESVLSSIRTTQSESIRQQSLSEEAQMEIAKREWATKMMEQFAIAPQSYDPTEELLMGSQYKLPEIQYDLVRAVEFGDVHAPRVAEAVETLFSPEQISRAREIIIEKNKPEEEEKMFPMGFPFSEKYLTSYTYHPELGYMEPPPKPEESSEILKTTGKSLVPGWLTVERWDSMSDSERRWAVVGDVSLSVLYLTGGYSAIRLALSKSASPYAATTQAELRREVIRVPVVDPAYAPRGQGLMGGTWRWVGESQVKYAPYKGVAPEAVPSGQVYTLIEPGTQGYIGSTYFTPSSSISPSGQTSFITKTSQVWVPGKPTPSSIIEFYPGAYSQFGVGQIPKLSNIPSQIVPYSSYSGGSITPSGLDLMKLKYQYGQGTDYTTGTWKQISAPPEPRGEMTGRNIDVLAPAGSGTGTGTDIVLTTRMTPSQAAHQSGHYGLTYIGPGGAPLYIPSKVDIPGQTPITPDREKTKVPSIVPVITPIPFSIHSPIVPRGSFSNINIPGFGITPSPTDIVIESPGVEPQPELSAAPSPTAVTPPDSTWDGTELWEIESPKPKWIPPTPMGFDEEEKKPVKKRRLPKGKPNFITLTNIESGLDVFTPLSISEAMEDESQEVSITKRKRIPITRDRRVVSGITRSMDRDQSLDRVYRGRSIPGRQNFDI